MVKWKDFTCVLYSLWLPCQQQWWAKIIVLISPRSNERLSSFSHNISNVIDSTRTPSLGYTIPAKMVCGYSFSWCRTKIMGIGSIRSLLNFVLLWMWFVKPMLHTLFSQNEDHELNRNWNSAIQMYQLSDNFSTVLLYICFRRTTEDFFFH